VRGEKERHLLGEEKETYYVRKGLCTGWCCNRLGFFQGKSSHNIGSEERGKRKNKSKHKEVDYLGAGKEHTPKCTKKGKERLLGEKV